MIMKTFDILGMWKVENRFWLDKCCFVVGNHCQYIFFLSISKYMVDIRKEVRDKKDVDVYDWKKK